jgi:molybdate transport system substrate-binding protein
MLIAAVAVAGCGSDDNSKKGGDVVVSAAASLKAAFTEYGKEFKSGNAQFSFAGSDELAAQIRGGATPDVFAAANTKLPDQLYAETLVEKPVVFATNRLVLAVPKNSKIKSLHDITLKGVSIAIGSPTVPIGSYTRTVFERLRPAARKAILANVKTQEPDVAGIVAKLTQDAAGAGFVYYTDVVATGGRLRAIELDSKLQPKVSYGAAIVKGAKNKTGARDFIAGLLKGTGAEALKKAGFGQPPP